MSRYCPKATSFYYTDHFKLGGEARPNENLGASGAAGKLRLSKLHCSERRELSERFSLDIAEAIQHQAFEVGQYLDHRTTQILSSAFLHLVCLRRPSDFLFRQLAQNLNINNVIFPYIKKHCKNSCLNCVNIVKYIRLSGRKLAKCKNISNLACT